MLRHFVVLLSAVTISYAGYQDGATGNDIGNGGNSYGYGYSGSFSGSGTPQNFGVPQFDFQGFLNNYLGSLANYHQDFMRKGGGSAAYSFASSSPSAKAEASSSLTFNYSKGIQAAATQGAGGYGGSFGIGNRGSFGGSFARPQSSLPAGGQSSGPGNSYGFGYGSGTGGAFGDSFSGQQGGGFVFPSSNGASASASYGPGGIQQTASVYPENPGVPNINTRFASSGQPDGFYSVFTSSQSQSSNVNGKPVTVNRATTTVNDNGKVTTYTAKNP